MALLPCAVALADTYATGFEPDVFSIGSVDGHDGWNSPPQAVNGTCTDQSPFQIDQGVVANANYVPGGVTGFESQSLRFSNLCANGAFSGTQIYSPKLTDPAGEKEANKVFTFEFSFIPTTTNYQPGLYVSVSPDNGEGHRMLRVDLTDEPFSCGDSPSCVLVSIADSPTGEDGYIVPHTVAVLDPAMSHTIKVSMKFNPGEDNDLARVLIDGKDTGQCFASWENFYSNWQPDQRFETNSDLQFRAFAPGFSGTNAGFLFDNVTYTSSTGPSPKGCDEQIEKQADSRTVTAGGIEGYRLTVRNRGRVTERNLLLCDHIPNHTTFVRANRKMRRLGSRRCFLIARIRPGHSASVHLMLHVNANAPPGNLDNIADITPVPPPGVPGVPPLLNTDRPPGLPPAAAHPVIKPIAKAKVIVRVIRAKRTPRPPVPPPVTG